MGIDPALKTCAWRRLDDIGGVDPKVKTYTKRDSSGFYTVFCLPRSKPFAFIRCAFCAEKIIRVSRPAE
jgi:hypothetical protein